MNDANMRGTQREWLAARIVILGGFVIAIAVAAYFTLRPAPQPAAEEQPSVAQQQQQQAAPAQQAANANNKAAMMVCTQELLSAKSFGIIPSYGQLSSAFPKATDVQGRYVCSAATQAAKYIIAADLVCRNLQDPRCVFLYSVTASDGTVLYQRQG